MAKTLVVNDQLDNITLMLAKIAENTAETSDGQGLYFKNFKTLQMINRMGLAPRVLDDYSYLVVNRETGLTAAAHGEGVTAVTVDEATFVDAIGTAESREYEFIYDGSAWHLDGVTVLLSAYGITITGTPVANDTITVDETATAVRYDVLGIDHDVPSDPNLKHTITLCRHDCTAYGSLVYKRPQGLIYVDPVAFPDGLSAGVTYYVNATYCTYDNTTKEDGLYGLTLPVAVPAGGLIRHSALGQYQSSEANYNQARILAGTWSTYDTVANGRTQISTDIQTELITDTSAATLLGTVTAETLSYRTADYLNSTKRNAYGSNAYISSDERTWMNSHAAQGADKNGVYLWQSSTLGKFDLPSTYNAAGNLFGFDPQLLAVIGAVRKRTFLSQWDRTDQDVKYIDTDEMVFPLSMNEANLGTTNDGVYENAVEQDGTVKTVPYAYWARRTTASERIKRQNGVARHWWLRSPFPSICYNVRYVNSSGSLGNSGASGTGGAADAYNIV